MCRFNMSFNDTLVDEVRPYFSDENKMLLWMQSQMEQIMREYAAQFRRDTVVDGVELLDRLKSLPNTPEGFLQLDTILKPSQTSVEELREEAYFEKYGV